MATETQTLERKVKASYLYNILKHASWHGRQSPRATKIAHVCIIGDRELSVLFKVLMEHHHQLQRHDLVVNVTYVAKGAAIPDCHMLFIGKAAEDRLSSILEQASRSPILTLSDIQGFADKGGMIELKRVKDGKKAFIRLRMNAARAEERNIALGIELQFIADHVDRPDLLIISDRFH
jgi:hypothetical protein